VSDAMCCRLFGVVLCLVFLGNKFDIACDKTFFKQNSLHVR